MAPDLGLKAGHMLLQLRQQPTHHANALCQRARLNPGHGRSTCR